MQASQEASARLNALREQLKNAEQKAMPLQELRDEAARLLVGALRGLAERAAEHAEQSKTAAQEAVGLEVLSAHRAVFNRL